MKKNLISLGMILVVLAASPVRAQDAATQQQLDKLSGQIQDLLDAQAQQGKRIDALEREIADLRDKVNAPAPNDYVSRDDLKKVVDEVNDIDKKRQDDRDVILEQIKKLGAIAAAPEQPRHSSSSNISSTPATGPGTDDTGTPQTGYYYPIKPGDTLGLIVKAYREQGVKVTKSQIIKANPKMNPNVLIPGKKIFIPDPSAKPVATSN